MNAILKIVTIVTVGPGLGVEHLRADGQVVARDVGHGVVEPLVCQLVVEHDFAHSRGLVGFTFTPEERALMTPVHHRLVRRNKTNGLKSLMIGAHAKCVVDWPEDESRAMLDDLISRAERHGHSHDWRQGDVIIWDNQAALHRATPYDSTRFRRLMQRTTISSRNEAALG